MAAPTEDMYISFSAADCFEGCERRYYYERVLKLATEEAAPLVVGNIYHAAIAEVTRHPGYDTAAAARIAVEEAGDALQRLSLDPDALYNELCFNVDRVREEVLANTKPAPFPDGGLFVERRFSDPELRYRGVIDLVSLTTPVTDGKGRIITWVDGQCVLDYKTVGGSRQRSDRDARYSPQLGLYALEVPGTTSCCFLEIPRDVEKPLRCLMATYKSDNLAVMKTYLEATRAAIISRGADMKAYKMTTRDNALCSPAWCPFYFKCFPPVKGGVDAVQGSGGPPPVQSGVAPPAEGSSNG